MTNIDHAYDHTGITPKGRGSVYKTVLDWFSTSKRGKVLDAPTGHGIVGMFLKKMGYEVTCGEIDPDIFQVQDLKCIYVDLNRRIDAEDETFDYVCCVDGLEHMTDPYRAVEEFSRVLKPGGYGVFTLPNYSNIEKRFKFFWFGYLTHPADMEKFRKAKSNLFNFHNTPLTITLLDLIFSINGLEIEKIMRNAVKKKQYLFLPVVWLMKLNAMMASEETKKKHGFSLTLKPEVILGGNNLVFITRKKKDHSPAVGDRQES
jgi:SAM-dependent methyltransferase